MLSKQIPRPILLGLTAFYVFSCLYAVASHRLWYSDGAWFYVDTLKTKLFFIDREDMRLFGSALIQAPAFLAMHLGLRNLTILSIIYDFPFIFQYFISIACCLRIAGRENIKYIVFPVLSLFIGSMPCFLLAFHHQHTMLCVFWPLLFIMLFQKKWGPVNLFFFSFFSLITLQIYESMLILGPVLASAALINRMKAKTRSEMICWSLAALIFSAGTLIALISVITPGHPGNFQQFKSSALNFMALSPSLFHPAAFLSVFGLIFTAVSLRMREKIFIFIFYFFLLINVLAPGIPLFFPEKIAPWLYYNTRAFGVLIPFFLSVTMIFFKSGQFSLNDGAWRRIFAITALLAFGQTALDVSMTYQWTRYVKAFQNELWTHQGLIANKDIRFMKHLKGRGLVNFGWDWTWPVMSLLLSPDGQIKTILLNRPNLITEPMPEKNFKQWPDLSEFGVIYDQSLSQNSSS